MYHLANGNEHNLLKASKYLKHPIKNTQVKIKFQYNECFQRTLIEHDHS